MKYIANKSGASPTEIRRAEFEKDPMLRQLLSSTPVHVENWLSANMTNLAEARQVMKSLLLAVRYLYSVQRESRYRQ